MKWLRTFTIRKQLIILASSTFIFLVIIFMVYYSQNRDIIMKKNAEYTTNIMMQLQQNVTEYSNGVSKILTNIAYNPDVHQYLIEKDDSKRYEMSKKISTILDNARLMKEGIADIVIQGKAGNFYSASGNVDFANSYKHAFDHLSTPSFTGIKMLSNEGGASSKTYFIIGLSVYSIYETQQEGYEIGYCFLIIDSAQVAPLTMRNYVDMGIKFYLLDRDQNVFSSNDKALLGKKMNFLPHISSENGKSSVLTVNGEKQIVQMDDLPEIKGTIVSMLPERTLFSELSKERLRVLVLLAVALLLLSIPFLIIINNLTKPIRQIMEVIWGIRSNDSDGLKTKIQLDGYSEMNLLAHKLNILFEEMDTLTQNLIDANVNLYKAELNKKLAELAFLQSQINPHFLYNTFETIKGMASVRGVPEIKEMAKDLSQIFRYSIQGSDEVELHKELEMVQAYLRIQKTRFKDRFEVELELEPETLACRVPRMIIQPIVENAIKHGLEPLPEKGNLLISTKMDPADRLIIVVQDNGVGFNEESVQLLSVGERNETNRLESHLGIMNVDNRIKLMYGEGYGLLLESSQETGTQVVFHLPIRRIQHV